MLKDKPVNIVVREAFFLQERLDRALVSKPHHPTVFVKQVFQRVDDNAVDMPPYNDHVYLLQNKMDHPAGNGGVIFDVIISEYINTNPEDAYFLLPRCVVLNVTWRERYGRKQQ